MAAALAAVADVGPGGVSGRQVAKDAEVHHAQIQQMFGSVDELVSSSVFAERDRFVADAFADVADLPSPLLIADHPLFWRAMAQVLLDPGHIDLRQLAQGGPVGVLARWLRDAGSGRDDGLDTAIASTWAAAPLGALIFIEPLQLGLGIAPEDWAHCWGRLGSRIAALMSIDQLQPVPVEQDLRHCDPVDEPIRGRERLLTTAQQLLDTRLETSVTGRELAEAAGVNYGLVSHYFGSKNAVFDEALTTLHRGFLRDVLERDNSGEPGAAFALFAEHRAFFRAWASRLLRHVDTPEFELRGMHQLMEQVNRSRSIGSRHRIRRLDAAGDAMTSVALQLGWTILRPLPEVVNPQRLDEIESMLRSVHRWILEDPEG